MNVFGREIKAAPPRMVLEQLGIAHIAAERVDRLVSTDVHHFENGCAALGSRRRDSKITEYADGRQKNCGIGMKSKTCRAAAINTDVNMSATGTLSKYSRNMRTIPSRYNITKKAINKSVTLMAQLNNHNGSVTLIRS
jgi:hypothetical protein